MGATPSSPAKADNRLRCQFTVAGTGQNARCVFITTGWDNENGIPSAAILKCGTQTKWGQVVTALKDWAEAECLSAKRELMKQHLSGAVKKGKTTVKLPSAMIVSDWDLPKSHSSDIYRETFTASEMMQPATFFVSPGEGFYLRFILQKEDWEPPQNPLMRSVSKASNELDQMKSNASNDFWRWWTEGAESLGAPCGCRRDPPPR